MFLQMQSDPATLEIPNAAETDWSPSKAELHKERTNELQTPMGCHEEVHRYFTQVLIINKIRLIFFTTVSIENNFANIQLAPSSPN